MPAAQNSKYWASQLSARTTLVAVTLTCHNLLSHSLIGTDKFCHYIFQPSCLLTDSPRPNSIRMVIFPNRVTRSILLPHTWSSSVCAVVLPDQLRIDIVLPFSNKQCYHFSHMGWILLLSRISRLYCMHIFGVKIIGPNQETRTRWTVVPTLIDTVIRSDIAPILKSLIHHYIGTVCLRSRFKQFSRTVQMISLSSIGLWVMRKTVTGAVHLHVPFRFASVNQSLFLSIPPMQFVIWVSTYILSSTGNKNKLVIISPFVYCQQ